MLSPKAIQKSMIHVQEDCKEQEAMFAVVLMTADAQLRKDTDGFCDNPYSHPSKSNSLDRKLFKRTLKNGDKDAEVWLSTTEGFWRGCRRGGLRYL